MGKQERILIGDVFCVEVDNRFKNYFQYVARDKTQLSSQVIRVFARHYPIDSEPNSDEIVTDVVSFYAHTFIKAGILYNGWYKVGKSKNLGDTEGLMFKMSDIGRPNWWIWKINTPFVHVGTLTDEERRYDLGIVYSYLNIFHKIETGHYINEHLDTWEESQ